MSIKFDEMANFGNDDNDSFATQNACVNFKLVSLNLAIFEDLPSVANYLPRSMDIIRSYRVLGWT